MIAFRAHRCLFLVIINFMDFLSHCRPVVVKAIDFIELLQPILGYCANLIVRKGACIQFYVSTIDVQILTYSHKLLLTHFVDPVKDFTLE